jgi:hypothetical protein
LCTGRPVSILPATADTSAGDGVFRLREEAWTRLSKVEATIAKAVAQLVTRTRRLAFVQTRIVGQRLAVEEGVRHGQEAGTEPTQVELQ